eukprot:6962607-Pyramimonas_sp.AAC.1
MRERGRRLLEALRRLQEAVRRLEEALRRAQEALRRAPEALPRGCSLASESPRGSSERLFGDFGKPQRLSSERLFYEGGEEPLWRPPTLHSTR